MSEYNHKAIEKKWQEKWEQSGIYTATENSKKKKFFGLIEFPYPSGDGLHVGHIRSNTAMDIICRKRRAEGFEVLYPIGWDAFGLPTENYAIKTGRNPNEVTLENTDTFRRQLKALGFSFDWSREVDTTDPAYYKWTQWLFLQFYKHGLAYKKKMAINWCPKDLIGLANEEVVDGCCERCGTKVEKREKEQWMLAITKYADRLDKDLDTVDFLERIKIQQRNWIGRSEGAQIRFMIHDSRIMNEIGEVEIFTTRPDTLFGATYLVLAPEHSFVTNNLKLTTNKEEILAYIKKTQDKTEEDRTEVSKNKTGVELKGIYAINPANNEKIPVWIADYVLPQYGTGAIMAVPAHDDRDFEFAKKYNLAIRHVIAPLFPALKDSRDEVRPDKPTEKRKTIYGIVKHWKDDSYLCLDWGKLGWHSFVIGGVEAGEDVIEAATREIKEETGYQHIKFVRKVGGETHASFYAHHKEVNRYSISEAYHFELIDGEKIEVAEEETKKHTAVWVAEKDMATFLNLSNLNYVWEQFKKETAYTGAGTIINSGAFNDIPIDEAKKMITESVGGKMVTTYKLRDWVFSRQRYWGEPIPMVHCEKCGIVPVPEKDLPVTLPEVKNYKPTETGESPLASISEWVNTTCPKCNGKAKRETDTMPNWAGSSWYYLRYTDPKNTTAFADADKLRYWTPVDWYNGGMEHTTLHLLYSRFWHKFLYDLKLVPTSEPYQKRTSHGLILAKGGVKMSKSIGNVVNPDSIVETVGADTLRIYEMFMGPFDQAIAWDTDSIAGSRRFVERVWKLRDKLSDNRTQTTDPKAKEIKILLHKTTKKVGEDIEAMKFNTAISAMMIFVSELEKTESISKATYGTLLQLLAPFAPHFTEELWEMIGHADSIHLEPWPTYDPKKLVSDTVTIAVQINGKMRTTFVANRSISEDDAKKTALALPESIKWLDGKEPKKVIYIVGKIVSIVI
ncbi:MAG: class I tRNA ligase family protein [Patescibacteria group bacterium]